MVLFFLLLITPSAAFKQYSHGLRRHSEPPRAVSTGEISEERALAAIRAAPIERRNNAAYDLAERLMLAPMFSRGAWREAFRSLITADAFVRYGWASRPFKLEEDWGFAVGAYTMADVERDVTRMPPQFVAHGVEYQGGIYNRPMVDGFTFAEVAEAMDGATVVMLNAGFLVPKLAEVSLAMLEATGLPIWLNVYISKVGLTRSTQCHTDKQDVLLCQCTGRKRWRVYRPPPPSDSPDLDPFARGKGTDLMAPPKSDLLIDTVMEPGQVLYIPAGFPHETDTLLQGESAPKGAEKAAAAAQPSVHLTVGIDTHLWGLSYAKLREIAAGRSSPPPEAAMAMEAAAATEHLPMPAWSQLHTPLPLGFLAAEKLAPLLEIKGCVENAEAEAALVSAMAAEARVRFATASGASDSRVESRAEEGDSLLASCRRILQHHREVLRLQAGMYRRTLAASLVASSSLRLEEMPPSARDRKAAIADLMEDFDRLDLAMANLDAWGRGEKLKLAAISGKKSGFGGSAEGGSGGTKATSNKGLKKKKKKKKQIKS